MFVCVNAALLLLCLCVLFSFQVSGSTYLITAEAAQLLKGFFWGKFFHSRIDGLMSEGVVYAVRVVKQIAICDFEPYK